MNNIEERARKIIAVCLNISADRVTGKASFTDDLGADSLDTVEIVMALEEEFEIDIPDEDAEKIFCFGDVIAYLSSNISSSTA